MARDSKGRFVKGGDPDRHVFTDAECKAGHEALVRKMPAESYNLRRKQAFRVITKTDCARKGDPVPVYPEKIVFGINESERDKKNWLKNGTKEGG